MVLTRTQSGHLEILQKALGLTQSERLVLLLVDRETTRARLLDRLSGLSEARFERALGGLLSLGLLEEVSPGEYPERYEQGIAAANTSTLQESASPNTLPFAVADHDSPPGTSVKHTAEIDASALPQSDLNVVPPKRVAVDIYLPLEKLAASTPEQRVESASMALRLSPLVPAHGRRSDDAVVGVHQIARPRWAKKRYWLTIVGVASAALLSALQASR